MNLYFLSQGHGTEARGWMSRIGHAKLTAKTDGRNATGAIDRARVVQVGHCSKQVADQTVKLRVSNKMGRRLIAQ